MLTSGGLKKQLKVNKDSWFAFFLKNWLQGARLFESRVYLSINLITKFRKLQTKLPKL